MDQRSGLSVDELRRQTESTRASLSATVDKVREAVEDTTSEWKAKVSPAYIKQEVKDYVREGGEHLSASLRRKVRENPLQAAAIGAGLAYPLLGLLRNVPIPVLLIGAGFWLAQRGNGDGASSAASDHRGSTRPTAGTRGDFTGDLPGTFSSTSSVTDKIRQSAHDARDAAALMTDSLTESLHEAAGTLGATAEAARSKMSEVAQRSQNALANTIERNPLMAAGVGLAVGAFIAASLPASVAESRLLGKTSDRLKRKAGRAASQGLDRVSELVSDKVGEVAETARREGLTAERAATVAEDIVTGVKAVANRGIEAAFDDQGGVQQHNKQG